MIAIDKEMPKTCFECDYSGLEYDENIERKSYCYKLNRFCTNPNNERLSDCPLKEIVTCKECKYWRKDWNPSIDDKEHEWHYCEMIDTPTREDYFCADGERKEE